MIGDLQRGYEQVSIEYHDATLRSITTSELISFDLCNPEHELVSDEIDVAAGSNSQDLWIGVSRGLRFSS